MDSARMIWSDDNWIANNHNSSFGLNEINVSKKIIIEMKREDQNIEKKKKNCFVQRNNNINITKILFLSYTSAQKHTQ